ncbi:MAG: PadR family transcriptional regulator [Clostridiaceae bacterium]|jgi:DNA-binding PadR family transcriptional regulator|nr:PadR family transcriptional regulator [Clostridiaceae bacterium]
MLLEYTILGLLSEKPMTGYDLKKVIAASSCLYWSGNNNQIYKALLSLVGQACLSSETIHQDGAPSKKVYAVTDAGREALSAWLESAPVEPPEFRNPFLVQLSLAVTAAPGRVRAMLERYREELAMRQAMEHERHRRRSLAGASWLDRQLYKNLDRFYQAELDWARQALTEWQQRTESNP